MSKESVFPKAHIPYGTWASSFFPERNKSGLGKVAIPRFSALGMTVMMQERNVKMSELDYLIVGSTIPWIYKFYGAGFLSHLTGHRVPGHHMENACATGLRVIINAMMHIQATTLDKVIGCLTFDRTSTSPVLVVPGQGTHEDTAAISSVWHNFLKDPSAEEAGFNPAKGETAMAACGARVFQNLKKKYKDKDLEKLLAELAFQLYKHYHDTQDSRFLQNKVLFPLPVFDIRGKEIDMIDSDRGVRKFNSAEEIASLPQHFPGVNAGTQTHPSDGMATLLVTNKEKADELSLDKNITIQLMGFAEVRVGMRLMPEAPIHAVKKAFKETGLSMKDMAVISTHNPFTINDLGLSLEFDISWDKLNVTGSPLIYGHPQAPTLMRVIIEALETAVQKGGGYVLVCGCAAGDQGIAAIFKVNTGGN
jgi:acetyl-CoA acetyltransferase